MSIIKTHFPKMRFSIIVVFTLFLISCKQKDNTDIPPVNMSDTIVTHLDKAKGINQQIDDTIHLNFIDEKGLFTVEGSIDSIHPRVYVKFENDDLGTLSANIIAPVGKGNIRFNQIVFPDETSDGPFGMNLDLELKQSGKHMLVIGHSLMADNPFKGKFKVKLQINRK
jgi:hypothetical protein